MAGGAEAHKFTKQKLTAVGIEGMISGRRNVIKKLQRRADDIAEHSFLGEEAPWQKVDRLGNVIEKVEHSIERLSLIQKGITTLNMLESRDQYIANIRRHTKEGHLAPTVQLAFDEAYKSVTEKAKEPKTAQSIAYIQELRAQQRAIWEESERDKNQAKAAIEQPASRGVRRPALEDKSEKHQGLVIEGDTVQFPNGKKAVGRRAQLLQLVHEGPKTAQELTDLMYGGVKGRGLSVLVTEVRKEILPGTGYSLINSARMRLGETRTEQGVYILVEPDYGFTPAEIRALATLVNLHLTSPSQSGIEQSIQPEVVKAIQFYGDEIPETEALTQTVEQKRERAVTKLEERLQEPYAASIIQSLQSTNPPVGDFFAQLHNLATALQQSGQNITLRQFLMQEKGKSYRIEGKSRLVDTQENL